MILNSGFKNSMIHVHAHLHVAGHFFNLIITFFLLGSMCIHSAFLISIELLVLATCSTCLCSASISTSNYDLITLCGG